MDIDDALCGCGGEHDGANTDGGCLLVALRTAAMDGDEGALLAVLSGRGDLRGLIDMPDLDGYNALRIAAMFGHDRVLEVLLLAGANAAGAAGPEFQGPGFSALHLASAGNGAIGGAAPLRTLDLLLKFGAAVNARDLLGRTALLIAATSGSAWTYEALTARGADVHTVDDAGCTPLLQYAKRGSLEMVQCLLQRGPNGGGDHTRCLSDGSSLFHAAAHSGNTLLVEWLADACGDPHAALRAANGAGQSPLQMHEARAGTDQGRPAMLALLRALAAVPEHLPALLAARRRLAFAKSMLPRAPFAAMLGVPEAAAAELVPDVVWLTVASAGGLLRERATHRECLHYMQSPNG